MNVRYLLVKSFIDWLSTSFPHTTHWYDYDMLHCLNIKGLENCLTLSFLGTLNICKCFVFSRTLATITDVFLSQTLRIRSIINIFKYHFVLSLFPLRKALTFYCISGSLAEIKTSGFVGIWIFTSLIFPGNFLSPRNQYFILLKNVNVNHCRVIVIACCCHLNFTHLRCPLDIFCHSFFVFSGGTLKEKRRPCLNMVSVHYLWSPSTVFVGYSFVKSRVNCVIRFVFNSIHIIVWH